MKSILPALVAILVSVPGIATAQENGTVVENPVTKSYAEQYGVSEAEAQRRLDMLPRIIELDARLRREFPDQFGGLYVEHQPFKIKVKSVGGTMIDLSRFTNDPAFVTESGSVSLVTLEKVQEQIVAILTKLKIRLDSGVDIRQGIIDTNVLDIGKARPALAALLSASPFLKLKQVTSLPSNTAAIIGGRLATGSTQECTTGFSVTGSAGAGITTAGHCDSTISVNGSSQALVARNYASSTTNGYDLQWNRKASDSYPNQIVISSSGTLMNITSIYDAKNLPAGWDICKFGNVTKYTCGKVVGQQATTDNNGVTGRFIRVSPNGSSPLTLEGDSGGPVFGNNTAYGSIKGRGGSSNPNDLYFMSVSDFGPLGITVKTAP